MYCTGGDQISDVTDVTLLCHIFSYRRLDCESGAENVGITVSLHAEFSFECFSACRGDYGVHQTRFSEILSVTAVRPAGRTPQTGIT